jgi:hypothetical protein
MAKQIARYDNYHSLANLSAGGTEALVLFKKGFENYPTVIDIGTGKEIARFGDALVPDAMALSPDGMTALLGCKKLMGDPRELGYEYEVIIWDVLGNTSNSIKVDFDINGLLWLDNSQFALLTRANITIYNTKGAVIKVHEVTKRGSHHSITRHADFIAVYGDKEIHLLDSVWELQKKLPIGDILKARPTGTFAPPFALAHDDMNVALITHKQPDAIWLWDVPSNKLVTKALGDADITAIEWLSDGYNEEKAKQHYVASLLYAEFMKSEGKSRIMMWDISAGGSTEFVRVQGEVNRIIATQDKIIISTNAYIKDDAIITVWDKRSLPSGNMRQYM